MPRHKTSRSVSSGAFLQARPVGSALRSLARHKKSLPKQARIRMIRLHSAGCWRPVAQQALVVSSRSWRAGHHRLPG